MGCASAGDEGMQTKPRPTNPNSRALRPPLHTNEANLADVRVPFHANRRACLSYRGPRAMPALHSISLLPTWCPNSTRNDSCTKLPKTRQLRCENHACVAQIEMYSAPTRMCAESRSHRHAPAHIHTLHSDTQTQSTCHTTTNTEIPHCNKHTKASNTTCKLASAR